MEVQSIDLSRLDLPSGGGCRIDAEVQLPEVDLGGERYAVLDVPAAVRLDVSRTSSGWAMRMRFELTVSGRCARCLEESPTELTIDAREVESPASTDEELHSPYVADDILDLDAWVRDALTLAMPSKYLCRPECPGLCSVCGEPFGGASTETHSHEQVVDPRWEQLRDVKLN